MKIEFDIAKNVANIEKHGLPMTAALGFIPEAAVALPSDRDGEPRVRAIGPIGLRLYVLVYTVRGANIRVISLRPAIRRERMLYVAEIEA
jgi:uncharacterized DUF497 family protein